MFPSKVIPSLFLASLILPSCSQSKSSDANDTGDNSRLVGVTVSGLSGTLVLQNNGADDLTVAADGSYNFATGVAAGASYDVTVLTQPSGQSCIVSGGTGTIVDVDISTVSVSCAVNLCSYPDHTVGLLYASGAASDGYVLFSPTASTSTYLLDNCGYRVKEWTSSYTPGLGAYLLPDGSVMRPGNTNNSSFNAGGSAGIIEKYDWDNQLTWSYSISSATECSHHDVKVLPNGHILVIAWELISATDAANLGRNPNLTHASGVWSEKILELQPSGSNGATVVWEWHAKDHLVQHYDNTKPSYAVVGDNPQLIHFNYAASASNQDWLHINSVDYREDTDQILLSVHNFSEIWIIDHSTSTAEAASHAGGKYGKGGDLLFRWGNPAAYNKSTDDADQKLFKQHSAHWVPTGYGSYPGQISIFNNGQNRTDGSSYSSSMVVEATHTDGVFTSNSTGTFDAAISWDFTADPHYYASNLSSVQVQSNGDLLIDIGTSGHFLEVDKAGETVWEYISPITGSGAVAQGTDAASINNSVFMVQRYNKSYEGLSGRTLTPEATLESGSDYSCDCR